MRIIRLLIKILPFFCVVACSPVKTPLSNEYQINTFSTKKLVATPRSVTIFVSAPEAAAGYQTEQMLYVKKPFQLEAFAKNSWTSPPGEMLHPLLVQSLQSTGFFDAVASNPYSDATDYRLDTELLALEQNFLKKPSYIYFSAKVVLTHVDGNDIIASRIITRKIPCSMDTPYSGVIAANAAAREFTAAVNEFVVSHIKRV